MPTRYADEILAAVMTTAVLTTMSCQGVGEQGRAQANANLPIATTTPKLVSADDSIRLTWAIVETDTLDPEVCCNSKTAYRLVITVGSRSDTLRFLSLLPHTLDDSTLVLPVVAPDTRIGFVRYHANTRSSTPMTGPPGFQPLTSNLAFAPRRHLLAYSYLDPQSSHDVIVVASVPDWEVILTRPVPPQCSDAGVGLEWTFRGSMVRWYGRTCEGNPMEGVIEVPGSDRSG